MGLVIQRIARFLATRFAAQYLLYGVLWTLTVEAAGALVAPPSAGTDWRPTWQSGVRVVIVILVFVYLRMVDDLKDLPYDREHHPDRPLVTGVVTAADLRAGMILTAVIATAAAVALSIWSAVLVVATLAYGLALWAIERRSERVRTRAILNLVITYPIQIVLTASLLISAISTGQVAADPLVGVTIVIFAGTFLQFEFARKTARDGSPGEHLYSSVLGVAGSALTVGLLAVIAVGTYVLLVQPWAIGPLAWLPCAPLAVILPAVVRYLTSSRPRFPLAPPAIFVFTFYVSLLVVALWA
jgi:4-hydroxybenzoate polyprenyltransferase